MGTMRLLMMPLAVAALVALPGRAAQVRVSRCASALEI